MESHAIDYDRTTIPAGYDRGRDLTPEMVALWMDALGRHAAQPIGRIIDLGCGTGRFTQPLASRFQCEVIGIDPSIKMLAQAW